MEDVDAAFEQIVQSGHELHALVLNAADLGINMPALTTDINDWMRVINTNLGWNFKITQSAARLITGQGGSIVFVSSNYISAALIRRRSVISS
ncbi:MAG: SDR family oxidoreductase [Lachnospiraceae bacterium]|nr:SDR family oxidoreductase [Lachnospiraceae bacterium]